MIKQVRHFRDSGDLPSIQELIVVSERVFTVTGSAATSAQPIALAEAGLRERSDLQEWVLAHPEIIGEGVLVVTFEFDRWQAFGGARERDRLDVLGLGADGRLVVAELKRDRAPDTVEMQAIKYAAMASRFTEDTLVEQHARFLSRDGTVVDQDTVRQRLIEHAGDLDPEQLRRPRIVLVAGSFPPVVTATVVWLSEMGVDVALQRVQAYRVFDDKTVVTVSQLFPVADVEEFTVSPQRQQLQAAEERRRTTREKSTVQRLVTAGSIPDGTPLMLRPTTEVTPEVRTAIEAWVNQDPRRGRAHWYNDRRQPLAWEYDGGRYRPTEIVRRILADAAGVQRNPRGPAWWVMEDGRDLPTVAGVPERSTFDWAELHQVLEAIPVGRWTTYGELAALIGTAAQPLGQHIQHCPACPNVHRVLGADGEPRPGLAWVDPNETRGQQEWLQAEGVRFSNGAAEPGRHLDVEALAALVEQE
jgi:alkylated DNA nucleotide flippase Atl1